VGLWQWLAPPGGRGSRLQVSRLTRSGWFGSLLVCAVLWPATGILLDAATNTDVPWWDAFPTALSLVAQFLLARKILENWALWIVVDLASIGLYAYKGLWLTVSLYTVFIALCIAGWREWKRDIR
jgi:nicotinamide mononucleotide transporter